MDIGRKDLVWNYAATFMRVASGLIVLPLILRMLPSEDVGVWGVFLAVGSLVYLLDFGFSSAIARNVTYIFSGVKTLKAEGYVSVDEDKSIDYGLLNSVISAMRRHYGILAAIFLLIFLVAGPFYLSNYVLSKYTGDVSRIWTAWFVYGFLVSYQIYTQYYGSLLIGRGQMKRYQQIIIVGQGSRIFVSAICLLLGFGLFSMIIGQLLGDLLNRNLCYFAFYDKVLKSKLKEVSADRIKEVMRAITPNAVKMGFVALGTFLVSQSIILIAPYYLSLPEVASYSITKQMIDLILALGLIWINTFMPQISSYRVTGKEDHLKRMYTKAKTIQIAVFIVCGLGLVFVVPYLFKIINSQTELFPASLMAVFVIFAYFDANQLLATRMILTKNEAPFAKSAILTGIGAVLLLFLGLELTNLGIWALVLAPGIAQMAYQDWKWLFTLKKELNTSLNDYKDILSSWLKE